MRALNFGALPSFLVMTDEDRLPDPLAVLGRLPPGCAVIVRHYGAPDRATLARRLVAAAGPLGIPVLIAGDWRLALRVGADGLHLPDAMARRGPGPWTSAARPGFLVTAAAHDRAGLARAARAGAEAVLLAPVFATKSHPERRALGPLRFRRWLNDSPLPVYALGGVDDKGWRRLRGSGAAGFAGIGAFTG